MFTAYNKLLQVVNLDIILQFDINSPQFKCLEYGEIRSVHSMLTDLSSSFVQA